MRRSRVLAAFDPCVGSLENGLPLESESTLILGKIVKIPIRGNFVFLELILI